MCVGVDSRGLTSSSSESLSEPAFSASMSRKPPSQLVSLPRAPLSLQPHETILLSAVRANTCMPPQSTCTTRYASLSLPSSFGMTVARLASFFLGPRPSSPLMSPVPNAYTVRMSVGALLMTGRSEVSGGAEVKLLRVSTGSAEKDDEKDAAATAAAAALAFVGLGRFASSSRSASELLRRLEVTFCAFGCSSMALRFLDVLGFIDVPLTTGSTLGAARARVDLGGIVERVCCVMISRLWLVDC